MKIPRNVIWTYNSKANYSRIYWSHLINDNHGFTFVGTKLDFNEGHVLQLAVL